MSKQIWSAKLLKRTGNLYSSEFGPIRKPPALYFCGMQRIAYVFLRLVIVLFRWLPFRLLYLLSDGLAFLLQHVVRYRKKVIADNLYRAFPEKTKAEIREITRKSYQNLTDVLLETLKSFTLPIEEITRRCRPVNPELLNRYLDVNQPLILTGTHLGNWEYSGLSMPTTFHGSTITAYKPLSNKAMENFLNRSRARTGMELVQMDDVYRVMRKRSAEAVVFLLLSDQSPSSRKSAHWVSFFGRQTASLPGVDVLSRKFVYPVLYYRTERLRRGFYEIVFEEICSDPGIMPEESITQCYTKLLERDIRKQPGQWLWSHRRWKMAPQQG